MYGAIFVTFSIVALFVKTVEQYDCLLYFLPSL